jgi:hypothetical protein
LSRQLRSLATDDIRYIVIHIADVPEERLAAWREYLTILPTYEDDYLLAYRTRPVLGQDFAAEHTLGGGLALVQASVTPTRTTQGGTVWVDLRWTATHTPTKDYATRLTLLNPAGEVVQERTMRPCDDWPTSDWERHALALDRHQVQVDPHLPSSTYQLTLSVVERETGAVLTPTQTIATMEVSALERRFTTPPIQHTASAIFGQALTLLGYDLHQEVGMLHLTLHWQALRRLDYYKTFVHLYDVQSGILITQHDTVPREWTYPTNWWEAGEVVSDEIALSLEGVPTGVYRIDVGVYEPDTSERLPVQTQDDGPLDDHLELETEIRLP